MHYSPDIEWLINEKQGKLNSFHPRDHTVIQKVQIKEAACWGVLAILYSTSVFSRPEQGHCLK